MMQDQILDSTITSKSMQWMHHYQIQAFGFRSISIYWTVVLEKI